MRADLRRFIADEAGATMVEYGLIAAIISVAAVTALQSMGESLRTLFEAVTIYAASAGPRATP